MMCAHAIQVKKLTPIDDPDASVPFLREIISSLRKETEGKATLLGFIGSPFTLAAYSVEGKANKNCFNTKQMMYNEPAMLHAFLDHIAENIAAYAIHQIECGAQVLQVFESWAHHLGPDDFDVFAKPYADKAIRLIKEKHPDTPIIYFANGGSAYLERQKDMNADMICVDWQVWKTDPCKCSRVSHSSYVGGMWKVLVWSVATRDGDVR